MNQAPINSRLSPVLRKIEEPEFKAYLETRPSDRGSDPEVKAKLKEYSTQWLARPGIKEHLKRYAAEYWRSGVGKANATRWRLKPENRAKERAKNLAIQRNRAAARRLGIPSILYNSLKVIHQFDSTTSSQ